MFLHLPRNNLRTLESFPHPTRTKMLTRLTNSYSRQSRTFLGFWILGIIFQASAQFRPKRARSIYGAGNSTMNTFAL